MSAPRVNERHGFNLADLEDVPSLLNEHTLLFLLLIQQSVLWFSRMCVFVTLGFEMDLICRSHFEGVIDFALL